MSPTNATLCTGITRYRYTSHKCHIKTVSLPIQTLLRNNATASIFQDHLSHTKWTAAEVSDFLIRKADDKRPPGSALTWRDIFNETDDAIKSISRFMEVSVASQPSLLVQGSPSQLEAPCKVLLKGTLHRCSH